MKRVNLTVSRKPVTTLQEVNRGYSKYKNLLCQTNFLQVISQSELQSEGLFELARAHGIESRVVSLNFKEVDNHKIVEELAQLARLRPNFVLTGGRLEEDLPDAEGTYETLAIEIEGGLIQVTIL